MRTTIWLGRIERIRNPQVRTLHRQAKIRWHYADYGVPFAFNANILADNGEVFTELSAPQVMAEEDHSIGSGAILIRSEPAAKRRRYSQHRQQSRRDPCAGHAFRRVLVRRVRKAKAVFLVCSDPCENGVLFFPFHQVAVCDGEKGEICSSIAVPD